MDYASFYWPPGEEGGGGREGGREGGRGREEGRWREGEVGRGREREGGWWKREGNRVVAGGRREKKHTVH